MSRYNFTRQYRFEDSSMVSEMRYDPVAHAVLVRFRNNGAVYIIEDISPIDMAAMAVAPSVGRAYHRLIPDHYNPIRYHDTQESDTGAFLDA